MNSNVDERERLLQALDQINSIIELIDGNEHQQYMFLHLNPVYYELERQLTNLTIADKIETTNQESDMATTYSIEEYNTVGWELIDPHKGLTKEQAKVKLEDLIREGYNPNRLRAQPDGTV